MLNYYGADLSTTLDHWPINDSKLVLLDETLSTALYNDLCKQTS